MNAYRVSGISAEAKKSGWVDVQADNVIKAVESAVPQFDFTPINLTVMFLKEVDSSTTT